jgi:MFS family permease
MVALAILAGITAGAYVGKAPTALPLLRDELNLNIVQAGWTVSIIAAMAMASGMAAGMVADRIGHRRFLIIGLLTMAISSIAGSVADDPEELLVTRFFEGVGFISVVVSAPSLIMTSILHRHRQVVLGVWSVWLPAGIALSMVVSPLILGPLGWRALWMFWAVMAIGLVAALLAKRPTTPRQEAPRQPRHSFVSSLRLILGRPGPLILALNFCMFGTQWGSMMMWIPSFLVEQHALPLSTAAMMAGLVVAVNVPGNLLGSWLLHRGVKRRHLIGLTHLAMGLCAIGVFSDNLPDMTRYGLVVLFSHVGGYLPPAIFASVPTHSPTPQQFGATNGLLLQGSNTGNFFGPPAVAAVVAALGTWNGVLWLMLASAGVGIALTFWLAAVENRFLQDAQGE